MVKRIISIFLLSCLCVSLCACSNDEAQETSLKVEEKFNELERAAKVQEAVLKPLKQYINGLITWDEARWTIDNSIGDIYNNWESNIKSMYGELCSIDSNYIDEVNFKVDNEDERGVISRAIKNFKRFDFENPQCEEEKLAAQIQEEILEILEKCLDGETNVRFLSEDLSEIRDNWANQSQIIDLRNCLSEFLYGLSPAFSETEEEKMLYAERVATKISKYRFEY